MSIPVRMLYRFGAQKTIAMLVLVVIGLLVSE